MILDGMMGKLYRNSKMLSCSAALAIMKGYTEDHKVHAGSYSLKIAQILKTKKSVGQKEIEKT
jgi:hypothetical protein